MSKRQDILNAFKASLEDIQEIQEVVVNKVSPSDISVRPLPCAFVFSGPSTKVERAVIGFETWNWNVITEIWLQEEDIEEWIERLHRKLSEDYTRNGNSDESYLIDTDTVVLNPTKDLQSVILIWKVRYDHKFGEP